MAVTYTVEMDFGRDGTFGHAQAVITSRVQDASWTMGMSEALAEFATPSRMSLRLENIDGAWSPDLAGATYRGLLVPGVLVRLRATWGGTTRTLWTGKVTQIAAVPGRYANESGGWHAVNITAEDPMGELLTVEYAPRLLLDARTDEAIRALFDAGVFVYPYSKSALMLDSGRLDVERLWDASGMLSLDTGETVLAWAGDNLDQGRGVSGQTYLREAVAAEAGGRFFWDGRTGKFAFHNRYRDAPRTPDATLGGEYLAGAVAAFGKELANIVTVQYEPRAIGTPNTLLWEIDAPFTLRSGEERVLTARYRDVTVKDAKVSALSVLPIQVGDIVANEQSSAKAKKTDPGPPPGRDVSAQMNTFVEAKASSAKVTVKNPLGVSVQVTTLKLRGTPLTTYARDEAMAMDGASIRDYDKREALIVMRAIDDAEFAAGLAGVHLARRKRAVNRWEKATLKVGWLMSGAEEDFVQGQIVQRTVGDRVRLSDAWSGHDAQYIIVGEAHRLDARTCIHETTWTLKPALMEQWFRLDASALGGTDVLVL